MGKFAPKKKKPTSGNQKFSKDRKATFDNMKKAFNRKNANASFDATDSSGMDNYASKTRINDLTWYVSDQQLLNDVARINYNIPVGEPLTNPGTLANINANEYNMAIPGIMCMDVVPTYGFATNPADPVNAAFAGMFTFIRSRTSSKFDWDDNTLGINMLAADSVYYYTTWLQRIYATLPLWHQANKYLPQALLEVQGVDYDDVKDNANWFREQINLYIDRINALAIPSGLYIFARHKWLFQNYYIEGESTKDQIYMYRPAAIYIHTKDSSGLSKLECHRVLAGGTGTDGRLTARDLIRKLESMLDPIFNDQYFNLISGYIREAYEGNVMHLDYIPDHVGLPLVFSEEVLLQFKNAKLMPVRHADGGATYYDNTFDVEQKPASATDIRVCLKTKRNADAFRLYRRINDDVAVHADSSAASDELWMFYYIANEYSKKVLITSPHSDVTPAENMINTRLIPSLIVSNNASNPAPAVTIYNQIACGTEWPVAVDVYCRAYDNWTSSWDYVKLRLHTVMSFDPFATDGTPFRVSTRYLPLISKFKYAPELKLVTRSAALDPLDPSTDDAIAPAEQSFFDVDNYALIDRQDLTELHNSAILSMLRVPVIANSPI